MSQFEFAQALRVQPSAISRLERGGRDPRLDTIVRVARVLETTPAELIRDIP